MKVLHINEHVERKGGVETYLLALLPLLAERGVESVVAYAKGEPGDGIDARALPAISRVGGDGAARAETRALLDDLAPDLVHLHNFQNVGVVEACLDRVPVVMTSHDYRSVCPANMFFFKRTREVCTRDGAGPGCFAQTAMKHCLTPRPRYASYYYRRARWMTAQADRFAHVVAPSEGARRRLLQGGFAPERVGVLPYFCPLPPADAPRPVPDVPTMTFLGRLAPNKGHDHFVRALGQLPGVRGEIVGNMTDEGEASLRAIAREAGCADRLVLRRWASREEVQALMDRTSVFVFPSLWEETLGIVGIEALARGVPVVGTDLGGVPQWLHDGVNGRLVPPKDPGAIAAAVGELVADVKRLEAFGEAGIRTVRESFSPRGHVDELERLYRRVEAGAPAGDVQGGIPMIQP